MQHKEAVVKTPLDRASLLPSRPELKTNEQNRVLTDLKANRYTEILLRKFIRSKEKARKAQERPLGLAVLPYVRGVSDQVGRLLQKFRIQTAFKPVRTSGHIFRKPKDRPPADRILGIVY